MIDHAVTIYTIIDDFLKARGHREDCRRKMSDAEVLTTAIVAAVDFGGVIAHAAAALKQSNVIPTMLSNGRLSVRLAAVTDVLVSLFEHVATHFKHLNSSGEYILDSMPLPISQMARLRRSRLVRSRSLRWHFIGKDVTRRQHFFGFRLHLLITPALMPVEFVLEPARRDDRHAFVSLPLALSSGSEIFTDANYGKYELEALLAETEQITLSPMRTRSYSRQDPMAERDYKRLTRRRIETAFAIFCGLLPRSIHVVSLRGFYRKILCFVIALQFLTAFL
jgi:hypothetical protein